MEMTAGAAAVRCLEVEDVAFAFGIASGKLNALMHALSESNRVRFIGVRHETAAALMAAGHFAGTGQIAVALGEAGPGGGNLFPGVSSAFANNIPLIAITSGNALHHTQPWRGMMMDLDLARVFEPITKLSVTVNDGRRLPEIMHRAFREATSGCPGPVHLHIPVDVLAGSHPYSDQAFSVPSSYRNTVRLEPAGGAVDQAVALLASARKPLIVAGGGAVISEASVVLEQLVTTLGAPAIASQMGIGAMSSDHPQFIGHGGIIGGPALRRALSEADVVLSAGCRMASWFWDGDGPLVRPPAKLIQIDTDPEALGRTTPCEIGIVADARVCLERLFLKLGDFQPGPSVLEWTEQLVAEYAAYIADFAAMPATCPGSDAPHPAHLALATKDAVSADSLIVYDGAHTTFWNNDIISAPVSRARFHEPGMAQLGFGLPYALALKAAHPDRTVINITGDGSFGFTIQELDTARREGLNVVNIIHNNAAWGIIRAGQSKAGFEFSTDLSGTDYAAIARGFGCFGETVNDPADLSDALSAAQASGLPSVIDCRVGFVPHPSMKAFGAMMSMPSPDQPLPA